ncbi:MAG: helix-turn-helix transcriptional regulator, partial [Bdellovibrio sp.]
MTGTYCQINSQSLRNYVLQRKITRAELASHMEVNTKTIQRWVNGHVTRVHIDAVKKLSTVLQCPLEDIIHPEKTLTVQTKNRALEELLSPEIFHQVHG